MRLSVIIVNYKTARLVLDCLASLYEFDTADAEIFVVDNDSNDGLEEMLQVKYPPVIFIQMGYNAGFARANNAGIRVAKGKIILLLNSDTLSPDDAVNKACARLSDSEYIAAGVQLLNADGSPQISGNFAMRGGLNYLLPLPYLGSFIKWTARLFKVQKPNIPKAAALEEADWINGAFLMVKKGSIDKAGLLDEDFFLYAEEAEWCSRLRKTGKLCIFGDLHVTHFEGASSAGVFNSESRGYHNLFDKKGFQIMLSNFLRIRKEFGLHWFLFHLLMYYFSVPVFFVGSLFAKLFSRLPVYTLADVKGFCINLGKLFKFVPRIISGKPFFYKVL